MKRLSYKNIDNFTNSIQKPTYSLDDLQGGIVHFGVGNFHRAHMQRYLHILFNQGKDYDWAIIGTGVTDYDRKMYQNFKQQDCLTTLVTQDNNTDTVFILGVMKSFIDPDDTEKIIQTLTSAHIKIVSLTVTEGGYFLNASGNFNAQHPHIQHDIENSDSPKTVFGLIVKSLIHRYAFGIKPFTIMSCDNIPHNGDVTRDIIIQLAQKIDIEFANWIQQNVAFPNSMVDCITPATGDEERIFLQNTYNIQDASPVFCEHFSQWILEDTFTMGRPQLESVGVEFVTDISDYEKMKIRILNGGHAILAYVSGLLEIEFVHTAISTPLIRAFLIKVETEEIYPLIPKIKDMTPQKYYDIMEHRLYNHKVKDTIQRLCFDGYNRQPKFIIPSIKEGLYKGNSVVGLALASALWCRYCFGTTDTGKFIAPNDNNWHTLQQYAKLAKHNPHMWLHMQDVYGDLGQSHIFSDIFNAWLQKIWQDGVEKTLTAYINNDIPVDTLIPLQAGGQK